MMKNKLSDLIEALQIFLKYGDPSYPTCCEHDVLFVEVDKTVTKTDEKRLEQLGFSWSPDFEAWHSHRFG